MENKIAAVKRGKFEIAIYKEHFEIIAEGVKFFILSPKCAVETAEASDAEKENMRLSFLEKDGSVIAVWSVESSVWDKKEYILEIFEKYFIYTVNIEGKSVPTAIDFFCGDVIAKKAGGVYEVSEYFLPMVEAGDENHYFSVTRDISLSVKYMVPPPLCLPFHADDTSSWLGIGLIAEYGKYNFESFCYKNVNHRARFMTELPDATSFGGKWSLPKIIGCFGNSEWDALSIYSDYHYKNGCSPSSYSPKRWWYGPFFCGWGEQAILKWKYNTDIFGASNEAVYTEISERLDALGLFPSAIIIDDKWQSDYGTFLPDVKKWSDLRAFSDSQHKKGRRVILWYRCWSADGLPFDECITRNGEALCGDPTNPKYIERMKNTVKTLLSDMNGCCNCDGFKVDFADFVPKGGGLYTYERGVRGIELVKRLASLIYFASKEAKSDALVSLSACHPYFADAMDMARLHDYDTRLRSVDRCMKFRADLYRLMVPSALIDTDFPAFSGVRDTMRYIRFAPKIGVPDLYRLSNTDECIISDDNWKEVKSVWDSYIKLCDEKYGKI